MKNLREPEQSLRQRCEKLARRYFDQAGLKNEESKALFKLDIEAFAREIQQDAWNQASLKCGEISSDYKSAGMFIHEYAAAYCANAILLAATHAVKKSDNSNKEAWDCVAGCGLFYTEMGLTSAKCSQCGKEYFRSGGLTLFAESAKEE